jgi:hypothetical protein
MLKKVLPHFLMVTETCVSFTRGTWQVYTYTQTPIVQSPPPRHRLTGV